MRSFEVTPRNAENGYLELDRFKNTLHPSNPWNLPNAVLRAKLSFSCVVIEVSRPYAFCSDNFTPTRQSPAP